MSNDKDPLPPPAIAFLVDLKPEQQEKAGPDGPIVDADQLVGAFKKMVPAKDDKTVFEEKVWLLFTSRSQEHTDTVPHSTLSRVREPKSLASCMRTFATA